MPLSPRVGERLALAQVHAQEGRDVFPFALGAPTGTDQRRPKTPLVKWTLEATHDPAKVAALWRTRPLAYPGWRLPANHVALDVDEVAAFTAAGLELPVTASQVTPSGGYHLLFLTDGREVRQTVKEIPGADTRVGGKGWVGLYDVDSFLNNPIAPAPEWLYEGARTTETAAGDDSGHLGTRDDILSWAGSMRRARLSPEDIYEVLMRALETGHIVALDEGRPWTPKDLKQIAHEAGKWAMGEPQGNVTVNFVPRAKRLDEDLEQDGSWLTRLDAIDLTEPKPLSLGFLDPEDHTILFGDGGTGKGVIAAWWAAQLSHTQGVVILDYERHAKYEWRPRIQAFGGDLEHVWVVQPLQAIWDITERVRQEVEAVGASWLFVDSIGYACLGQEVEKSSTATRYSLAIAQIGLPTLSLAHTTKVDASPQHPFGSVFWSNGARITIGVSGRDRDPRLVENKKTNQRAPFAPVEIDWTWVDSGLPDTLTRLVRFPVTGGAGKEKGKAWSAKDPQSELPGGEFSALDAAQAWGTNLEDARKRLAALVARETFGKRSQILEGGKTGRTLYWRIEPSEQGGK